MEDNPENPNEQHVSEWVEFARGGHDEDIRAFREKLRPMRVRCEAMWCTSVEMLRLLCLPVGEIEAHATRIRSLIELFADLSGVLLARGEEVGEEDLEAFLARDPAIREKIAGIIHDVEWEAAVTLRIFSELRAWEVTTESVGLLCTEALAQVMEMARHRVADDYRSKAAKVARDALLEYIDEANKGAPVSRLALEGYLMLTGYWKFVDSMYADRELEYEIRRGGSQDLVALIDSLRQEYLPKLKQHYPSLPTGLRFDKLAK